MRLTTLTLVMFLSAGINTGLSATITFQDSFQYPTPAPGWSYLWNSAGPIGNPANYTALIANASGLYTSTGGDLKTPAPAYFLNFGLVDGLPGGHPGAGATQVGSGDIERYAIAAYTIAGPATVSIANGWLRNSNPNAMGSTDGLNLKVFVNSESSPRISTGTAPGTGSIALFGDALGDVASGSTIYVAVGSVNDDSFDGFQLKYDLEVDPRPDVPEPNTILLAGAGMALAIAMHGRRKKRDCASCR